MPRPDNSPDDFATDPVPDPATTPAPDPLADRDPERGRHLVWVALAAVIMLVMTYGVWNR